MTSFVLLSVRDKMAANSSNMDSESKLDTQMDSEDVSNVTLSSLMIAIKDISKTMERKFVEMESSLEKKRNLVTVC